MTIDKAYLTNHFREMSDEELLSRCGSAELTEVAQSIANEELATRGLRLPDPAPLVGESVPYAGDFVTVAQYLSPTDAHVIRGCLEAAEIPAFIGDANLVQTNALLAIAVGGVRIQVHAVHAAAAKDVIDAFNRGDLALNDGDNSYRE